MTTPDETALNAAVEEFAARLVDGTSPQSIVREMVTHGASRVIDGQTYARLRETAGAQLQVSPNQNVFMVGSAKLGFSIAPDNRYRLFGDESDVDLAIVSPNLYEQLWREIRRYVQGGGLWDAPSKRHFRNDHVGAVIKPYVLPDSDAIPTGRMLFDTQSMLQRVSGSPYAVTLAIWHEIDALEDYQIRAVRKCQEAARL